MQGNSQPALDREARYQLNEVLSIVKGDRYLRMVERYEIFREDLGYNF